MNFYNTRMLVMQSGADVIVSRDDFPLKISTMQKWGVPDQYLYQRTLNDLEKMPQPFLSMVYTISSHPPFDIPTYKKFTGKSFVDQYCNSIAYSDSCLGSFIDQLTSLVFKKNCHAVLIIFTTNTFQKTTAFPFTNKSTSSLHERSTRICTRQFTAVADEWEENCTTIGKDVTVQIGDRKIRGRAESLDDDGALLLRTEHGRLEAITGGDVTLEK